LARTRRGRQFIYRATAPEADLVDRLSALAVDRLVDRYGTAALRHFAVRLADLQAVVFHEDHHRRTRAPLRAAALGAWLRLLGRSTWVRDGLVDRLTDLETLADADAIRRGSSPGSLAQALLKGDAGLRPVSFAPAAGRRVDHLLAHAAGGPMDADAGPLHEWLPVVLLAVATLACRAVL
jgi:hypothetical protein